MDENDRAELERIKIAVKKIKNQAKTEKNENLKTAYAAVLKTHDAIADFRSKLLALLPFATGAGIFFLIKDMPDTITIHLVVIGLSGILVTIGLFFYELKNIQKCRTLIGTGKLLERKLLGKDFQLGAFHGGRIADKDWYESLQKSETDNKKKNIINQIKEKLIQENGLKKRKWMSNTRAALFVYSTVIAGWAYLAIFGFVDCLIIKFNFKIPVKMTLLSIYNQDLISIVTGLFIATIVFFMVFLKAYKIDERYHMATKKREELLEPIS